ncbi:uncharacterized protein YALI1_A17239g [Yarrowia lipolytica]|uniref:Uncharacterized protein n=1 Tax=Yarrowia lipolytica TaxID=4952 RepID=A0A1D8N557_YARLL|nr:hypothetical protein YALI1_A17239g [Yarrowia lipolytica]
MIISRTQLHQSPRPTLATLARGNKPWRFIRLTNTRTLQLCLTGLCFTRIYDNLVRSRWSRPDWSGSHDRWFLHTPIIIVAISVCFFHPDNRNSKCDIYEKLADAIDYRIRLKTNLELQRTAEPNPRQRTAVRLYCSLSFCPMTRIGGLHAVRVCSYNG